MSSFRTKYFLFIEFLICLFIHNLPSLVSILMTMTLTSLSDKLLTSVSFSFFLGFCLVPSVETCSPASSFCLAVCFSILCKPVMAPCLEGVVLCGRWTVLFNLFLVLGCPTKSLLVSLPWSPKMQSARHLPEPGTQGMSPVWAACDRWLWWCPTSGVGGGQRGYLLSVSASAAHKQCRAVGWGTLTHYCGQLRVSVQKWCPPVSSR